MAKETEFYLKGKRYWENVSATINGMLGGYSRVDKADIRASRRFLDGFFKDQVCPLKPGYALDCGSGIGRITKHLLVKHFRHVDMVEQNPHFLKASYEYLGDLNSKVLSKFNCGLQDFIPVPHTYDLIWIQWVIGYLTDKDLVECLKRLKEGLTRKGLIVMKENISTEEGNIEHIDGSITRTRPKLLHIFEEAGLTVVAERRQVKFPKKLLQVKMFALL